MPSKFLRGPIIGGVALCVVVAAMALLVINIADAVMSRDDGLSVQQKLAELGTIGDFSSGTMGVGLIAISMCLVAVGIFLEAFNFMEARDAMKKQQEALSDQNRLTERRNDIEFFMSLASRASIEELGDVNRPIVVHKRAIREAFEISTKRFNDAIDLLELFFATCPQSGRGRRDDLVRYMEQLGREKAPLNYPGDQWVEKASGCIPNR